MDPNETPLAGESNCANCDRPDSADDQVQCDRCSTWWHMSCAGVTQSVENRAWSCSKCVPATSYAGSVKSTSTTKSKRLALEMQKLQEEHELKMRQLKVQQDLERDFLERKFACLEAVLEENEEDGVSVRSRMTDGASRKKAQQWVDSLPTQEEGAAASTKPTVSDPAQAKGAIPKQIVPKQTTPKPIVPSPVLPNPVPPKPSTQPAPINQRNSTPKLDSSKKEVNPPKPGNPVDPKSPRPGKSSHPLLPVNANDEPNANDIANLEHLTKQFGLGANEILNLPTNINVFTPSPSQLAARQVMPRDLPTFSGNPADWPVFISNFMTSTLACGYSPAENLIRLQRSLKGPALEAVRSRLLLPESVPHIVETLRLLYGRPELLINALIDKVHSVPAPKAEKLESLIDFGMAVQTLCDHLEAANQQAHLSNPSLMIELVDKLPVHVKMEWVKYMENSEEVNLKVFGEFMRGIVKSASRLTLYTGSASKGDDNRRQKRAAVLSHTEAPQKSNVEGTEKNCPACHQRGHRLKECRTFSAYSVEGRCRFVQQQGICRNCLNAHGRRSCRSPGVCGVNGCQYRHHPLLHFPRSVTSTAENHIHRSIQPSLYFRIIPVTVHGGGRSITTFAFLDDGSSVTLIEDALVRQLGVDGDEQPLCLKWTGNMSRVEDESRTVSLSLSHGNQRRNELRNVRTVKELNLPTQSLDVAWLSNKYPHLRGVPVQSYDAAVPRLLVGIDNVRLTVPLKLKEGGADEPVAVKTRLGWCIFGGRGTTTTTPSVNVHACDCSSDQSLHNLVKQFFATEDIGSRPAEPIMSDEDKRACDLLEQTTRRVGDRYETGLLWRFDNFELPDSYGMALRRLECLERRMKREPELKDKMVQQLDGYLAKGYIHRATVEDLQHCDAKRVWYLPLGVVFNPKKPDKLRMIWDAAAKVQGISLNDMLLKGPDQLASLPAVLFRFRQFAVAVSADIAEMFHQILIRERDRHAQRFLWRSNPSEVPEVFLMNVATFGSTCSPASAQFVKNKNAMEFVDVYPRAVESIVKNHYVDDLMESFESVEEATRVTQEVRLIHSEGGFNIRNFQSNSSVVLNSLGEKDDSAVRCLDLQNPDKSERVLGLLWRPKEDTLGFSTLMQPEIQTLISVGATPTKRQVLKCLMSLFDPIGLLSTFTVQGKILLQSIWRSGIQWDQLINEACSERWREWIQLLDDVQGIRIPRCYFLGATATHYRNVELHVFVDASEEAYAAVAYFRTVDQRGEVDCSLVAAKTKVAPIKPMSVPRLELQAAVLGVRLTQFVTEGHSVRITKRVFWSDSSTVLSWINTHDRRYKQFVAVRIGEILTESNVAEWRYVPSKKNVADAATKWGKGPDLKPDSVWFTGPKFLWSREDQWPVNVAPKAAYAEEELRSVCVHQEVPKIHLMVDLERFSNWNRVLRATAYVHRFIGNIRAKPKERNAPSGSLTQMELAQALEYLIRAVQWEAYSDEIAILTKNMQLPVESRVPLERSSSIYRLSPVLDEHGVLRVDGRIQAAKDAACDTKFPVILPRKHRLTHLIIDYFHRKYHHGNPETVVNEVRQQYYIPKLRTAVRAVTGRCQWCKIRNARPHVPRMAPLPPARLASFTRPFSYVGLDLFGPLLVKVGRSNAKRWVALFTCLTIRAVHVEIVYTLSTESCIMSVRRFVSRRGSPLEIHSDNGTNFRGADGVLREQIRKVNGEMAETFTNTNTKWVFIPPSAPHMGGSWERMVRSVKSAMEAANGGRRLDDEGLLTLAIEAEGMVNSRPLTYLPLDSEEAEALTPNHFLLGSSSGVRQPAAKPADEAAALRSTWGQVQLQMDSFWKRWSREYLPTLTRRTKWFGEVKSVAVGDLVLIVEESRRNGWTRGRVCKVYAGQDGRIRQALVQTNRGLMRRPVSKLAILDVVQVGKTGHGASGDQCYGGETVANWAPCHGTAAPDCQATEMTRTSTGTLTAVINVTSTGNFDSCYQHYNLDEQRVSRTRR